MFTAMFGAITMDSSLRQEADDRLQYPNCFVVEKQSNQAVYLAETMFFTGLKSAVGTM